MLLTLDATAYLRDEGGVGESRVFGAFLLLGDSLRHFFFFVLFPPQPSVKGLELWPEWSTRDMFLIGHQKTNLVVHIKGPYITRIILILGLQHPAFFSYVKAGMRRTGSRYEGWLRHSRLCQRGCGCKL